MRGGKIEAEEEVVPSNTFRAWGLKKVAGSSPEVPEYIMKELERQGAFHIGNEAERRLFLTFDCGYENGYTGRILDILKEKEVNATFFVTGHFLRENHDLIRRMVAEGHNVGNHTVNHVVMPKVSDDVNRRELNDLRADFHAIVGEDVPMRYVRPPKGEYSEATLALSREEGYITVFWSSAYVDWEDDRKGDLEYAFNSIVNQFHNGSVILLHNTSGNNADVLADVIEKARSENFEFGNLDEIAGNV